MDGISSPQSSVWLGTNFFCLTFTTSWPAAVAARRASCSRAVESVGNATTFVEVDSVAERGSIRTLTSVEVDSVVGTLVVSVNCARTFPEDTWKSVEPMLAMAECISLNS